MGGGRGSQPMAQCCNVLHQRGRLPRPNIHWSGENSGRGAAICRLTHEPAGFWVSLHGIQCGMILMAPYRKQCCPHRHVCGCAAAAGAAHSSLRFQAGGWVWLGCGWTAAARRQRSPLHPSPAAGQAISPPQRTLMPPAVSLDWELMKPAQSMAMPSASMFGVEDRQKLPGLIA